MLRFSINIINIVICKMSWISDQKVQEQTIVYLEFDLSIMNVSLTSCNDPLAFIFMAFQICKIS